MIVAKELEIIFVRVPLREKGFTTKLGFIPANEKQAYQRHIVNKILEKPMQE